MALTKSQLIDELVEEGVGDRKHVNNMLNALSDIAADELEAGEDFTVPGVCKLFYTYRKPQKKGERWKKGETVTGFGGIEAVKEEDSPPVKAAIKLKANPTGAVARIRPGSKPEAQAAFLKSKAGKAVIKRKG
jgi:nucleoid DNA-binding protein